MFDGYRQRNGSRCLKGEPRPVRYWASRRGWARAQHDRETDWLSRAFGRYGIVGFEVLLGRRRTRPRVTWLSVARWVASSELVPPAARGVGFDAGMGRGGRDPLPLSPWLSTEQWVATSVIRVAPAADALGLQVSLWAGAERPDRSSYGCRTSNWLG